MPIILPSRRLLLGHVDYQRQVLSTRPYALVGYWPLDDLVGSTARNRAWPQTQLVANGGFEVAGAGGADVFADWTETAGDGTVADEDTFYYAGAHAARLTAGATANTQIAQSFPVVPGASYLLSFYARGSAGGAGRYGIYDVTNSADIVATTTTGVAAGYSQVTKSFTAPATCLQAQVIFLCQASDGNPVWVDDVVVSRNLDGTYTGVDLTNILGPFGRPCPFFDGTNDQVNIYSSPFAAGWSGAELTIAGWMRVQNAAVWPDGAIHRALSIRVNANNWVRFQAAGGGLTFYSTAGGTTVFVATDAMTDLGWMHLALTRSEAAGEMKGYLNGLQVGTTQGTIGTWAGALAATECRIGALDGTPTAPWQGWISDAAIWNAALSAAEIASLARR